MTGLLTRLYRECRTANYARGIKVHYVHDIEPHDGEALSLCWGATGPNFGDALSPLIVHLLSGRPLKGSNLEAYAGSARLLALGTIVERGHDGDLIWGSGCRNGELKAKHLDVRAVRGPLTRKYLQQHGIDCPKVYGDPAMLMPFFYRPGKEAQYDAGIIRHYADSSRMRDHAGLNIRVIDVTDDPLRVIDQICSCRAIISSSLHGLILAEAYGVPACWLYPDSAGWRYPEPEMKYRDYYHSTGRDGEPLRCGGVFELEQAVGMAQSYSHQELQLKRLLDSFPYLREGISELDDLYTFQISSLSVDVTVGDLFRRAWAKAVSRLNGR